MQAGNDVHPAFNRLQNDWPPRFRHATAGGRNADDQSVRVRRGRQITDHRHVTTHSQQITRRAAGLSPIECERVYLSGLLHDIGKIGVPDAVLTKPGRLTREEFDLLKKHPEIGQRILSRVRQIQDLVPGVLYHHERVDGRGYPHGVAGRDIPLFGRIICIADSFDAMTSNRTYRAALPIPMAISEIRRCSGSQFDPYLAERFLAANPHAMFEAAIEGARGESDIGRIGALFFQMNRGHASPIVKATGEGPMSLEGR